MATNLPDLPSYPITIDGLPPEGEGVPLHNSIHGQVRIDGTTVSLELFMGAYHAYSPTPELLAERFHSISSATAQAVLAYWQQNRAEVDEYLRLSAEQAEKIRQVFEPENTAHWNRIKERVRAKGLDALLREKGLIS